MNKKYVGDSLVLLGKKVRGHGFKVGAPEKRMQSTPPSLDSSLVRIKEPQITQRISSFCIRPECATYSIPKDSEVAQGNAGRGPRNQQQFKDVRQRINEQIEQVKEQVIIEKKLRRQRDMIDQVSQFYQVKAEHASVLKAEVEAYEQKQLFYKRPQNCPDVE